MMFFAVEHIPSGFLLPAGGKGRGGHMAQKPTDKNPPRLFMTERAALVAMGAYIRGRWQTEWVKARVGRGSIRDALGIPRKSLDPSAPEA